MRFTAACAAAAALIAFAAFAQETPKQGTQQSKFATCAHESKGLRGDEHQKFMSDCLKGHEHDASAKDSHRAGDNTASQQNRMRTCNEEAGRKALHGEERRAFMSTCLKG